MFFYNIFITFFVFGMNIAGMFNSKVSKGVKGRRIQFQNISKNHKNEKNAWFHCASLGEYEQAKPIILKLKKDYKIIVTFFSPSGFENVKDKTIVDYVYYLPFDTRKNAEEFIKLTNPSLVFFIKYELWCNFLSELFKLKIPTYLVAANFRENQFIFKWYGKFIFKLLPQFSKIFVQNNDSRILLEKHGINIVVEAGDTRFDNVYYNCKQVINNDIIEQFKDDKLLIVGGSCWVNEEQVLIKVLNRNLKVIFAPHNIEDSNINRLKNQLKNAIRYSEAKSIKTNLNQYQALIIDNIGLLKSIYKYADIVVVGGGFTNKLHNILEPAVFGKPILFGNNHSKFPEAKGLIEIGGAKGLQENELLKQIDNLINDEQIRKSMAQNSKKFVERQLGATDLIINNLK